MSPRPMFVLKQDVPRELRRGEAFEIVLSAAPRDGGPWLMSGMHVTVSADFAEEVEVVSEPSGATHGGRPFGPWEVTLRAETPQPMRITIRGRVRADAPLGEIPITIEAWRARRGDPKNAERESTAWRTVLSILPSPLW